jgi:hypothetical protein
VITYKRNKSNTVQAAHSGSVRIGYIDASDEHRWIWSLNMIQPGGGRATGIEENEQAAKQAIADALVKWVNAAGLEFKEQQNAEPQRSADREDA